MSWVESAKNYIPFSSKNSFFTTQRFFKQNISDITIMNVKDCSA